MKQYLIFLIFLWFMAGLTACAPQIEPLYAPVPVTPMRNMAVSPPALVFVTAQPTRAVSTATAVPTEILTDETTAVPSTTPTDTATDVPPTMPTLRETPTNAPPVASATLSGSEPTPAITVTTTPTDTLPNAQTPTPGWYHYASDVHGLMLQYPMHWHPALDRPYGLDGYDGFLRLYATNSQDNLLLNACQDMAMSTTLPIEWLTAAGQEACLVTADDGSVVTIIVRFPEPREAIVPGVAYAFLALQADPAHMPGFVQTLSFVPVTAVR